MSDTSHTMTKEEIYNTIKSLAHSQGCYSRLLAQLDSDEETKEKFLIALENQKFKDSVDLVLYLES